jgi:hypothetical protein
MTVLFDIIGLICLSGLAWLGTQAFLYDQQFSELEKEVNEQSKLLDDLNKIRNQLQKNNQRK